MAVKPGRLRHPSKKLTVPDWLKRDAGIDDGVGRDWFAKPFPQSVSGGSFSM